MCRRRSWQIFAVMVALSGAFMWMQHCATGTLQSPFVPAAKWVKQCQTHAAQRSARDTHTGHNDADFLQQLSATAKRQDQPCVSNGGESDLAAQALLFSPSPGALACDRVGSAVLATTFFSTRPDPQRGDVGRLRPAFIQDWLYTSRSFGHLRIVFVDNATRINSEAHGALFVYANVSQAGFSPAESLNDVRFCLYETFFQQLTRQCPQLRHVLLTDGSDVKFGRDPFEFMTSVKPRDLYVGRDYLLLLRDHDWLQKKLRNSFGLAGTLYANRDSLNAGVIGGRIIPVLKLLRTINACLFLAWDAPRNAEVRAEIASGHRTMFPNLNMAAFNMAIYWLSAPPVNFTLHYGAPFTNPFDITHRTWRAAWRRLWQTSSSLREYEEAFYIYHKYPA